MAVLVQTGDAHKTISAAQVLLRGDERAPRYTEEGALELVVQDAERAEQWMDTKQWALDWRSNDVLYQSPRTMKQWENATTAMSNVPSYTVAQHVNTLVPAMTSGIFYEKPPFQIRPRPMLSERTVRAKMALYNFLLDEMDFEAESETGIECQVLHGTAVFEYGWTVTKRYKKRYVRKNPPQTARLPLTGKLVVIHTKESDEYGIRDDEITESRPFFEFIPLGELLIDPGWRRGNSFKTAKYLIRKKYVTFADLDVLRQRDGYDIPSEEALKELFFPPAEVPVGPNVVQQQQSQNTLIHHAESPERETTADPLEHQLELLERWDNDRVMTVLNRTLVIRNDDHTFDDKPFLTCNFWNILNAGWGLGVGKLVGSEQRTTQGCRNAGLDILSLAVNQQYVRSRGANVPTQQIRSRLGGIIDVDGDVDKAFKILEPPRVPPEVWQAIAQSSQTAEAVDGSDQAFVQGTVPGPKSSVVRTATGAGNVAAASATRIAGPVGRFCKGVLIPFIYALDDMVRERMPLTEIRSILSSELGDDFDLDYDDFLNAEMKFEVLAGAHLAAKKAMAQSLPLMLQIFENPHLLQQMNATGWTVDVHELFEMLLEMSEWKNNRDIIRRMTKQELQMYQQSQQAPMQAQMARTQMQTQAQSALVDKKSEAKLAHDLIMHNAEGQQGERDRMLDSGERAADFAMRTSYEHAAAASPFLQQ